MRLFRSKLLLLISLSLLVLPVKLSAQSAGGDLTTQSAGATSCISTDCVRIQLPTGASSVLINIIGTHSGTDAFEFSPDGGTTWRALTAINLVSGATASSSTSTGTWAAPVNNFTHVQVRRTVHSSGTASVLLRSSDSPNVVNLVFGSSGGGGGGGEVTNAGIFGVQEDGAALTALQLIDDTVFVDDAVWTMGTSKGIGFLCGAEADTMGATDAGIAKCGTDRELDVDSDNVELPAAQLLADGLSIPTTTLIGAVLMCKQTTIDFCPVGTGGAGNVDANTARTYEADDSPVNDAAVELAAAINSSILDISQTPKTTGGLSIYRSLDLDEGTGEVVKNSTGQLYHLWVTNTATTTRFLHIFNATSCTVGTGTPVITIGIPGNASDDVAGQLGAGDSGIAFDTGICMGASTGAADNDTGAPGTGDVIINAFYK